MLKVKDLFVAIGTGAKKNSMALTAAVSVGGMIGAIIFSFRAAPKYKAILEKDESNLEKAKEIVKTKETWGLVASAGVSAAADFAMLKENKRLGELVSATSGALATVSRLANEQTKKTEEIVGKEKAEEIQKEVQKSLSEQKEEPKKLPAKTEDGKREFIFYEPITGAVWRSTPSEMRRRMDKLNIRIGDRWKSDKLTGMVYPPETDEYISIGNVVNFLAEEDIADGGLVNMYGYQLCTLDRKLTYDQHFGETTVYNNEPAFVFRIRSEGGIIPPSSQSVWFFNFKE